MRKRGRAAGPALGWPPGKSFGLRTVCRFGLPCWIGPDGSSPNFSQQMQGMVGFRSVAVHDYQRMSLEVVKSILESHLDDFRAFAAAMLSREADR